MLLNFESISSKSPLDSRNLPMGSRFRLTTSEVKLAHSETGQSYPLCLPFVPQMREACFLQRRKQRRTSYFKRLSCGDVNTSTSKLDCHKQFVRISANERD